MACASGRPAADPGAAIRLDRPAVIGASATSGFGLDVNMADGLVLALGLERDAILDGGRGFFFLDPAGTGASLVGEVQAFGPSAVVAVDYLFWFAYGRHGGVEARLASLERGLDLLDEIQAPIIVSTLPNMEASIGRMLSRPIVPRPAALARLNGRIAGWAAERPRVLIFDLPDLMGHLKTREPVLIAGRAWPVREGVEYIQSDHLHPTVPGMAVIICALIEQLSPECPLDPEALARDLEGLQTRRRADRRAGRDPD